MICRLTSDLQECQHMMQASVTCLHWYQDELFQGRVPGGNVIHMLKCQWWLHGCLMCTTFFSSGKQNFKPFVKMWHVKCTILLIDAEEISTSPGKGLGFEHPNITTAHVTSFNYLEFGKTTQTDVHRLWYWTVECYSWPRTWKIKLLVFGRQEYCMYK